MLRLAFFTALLCVVRTETERFDLYKVIEVIPQNKLHLSVLYDIEVNNVQVDFWRRPGPVGHAAHLMLSEKQFQVIDAQLRDVGLKPKVLVKNVQEIIDNESGESAKGSGFDKNADPKDIALDHYHSHQEINDYLDALASKYSHIVQIINLGKTHQNRTMKIIKIGSHSKMAKPKFWIDGGIHAREWISPATAIYIINELVTKYASVADYKKLVDNVDFYVLPVINADGYEYTRSDNRLWRKTRSGPRQGCYGVDPNRNWDFKWMYSGSSQNPCSNVYAGPKPFSEVECKQMAQFLLTNKMMAGLTLHSYGELWMYSYGYEYHTYPPDVAELKALGHRSAAAIKAVHDTTYQVGSPTDVLSAASGASDDWTKAVAKIKYVYTVELRPGRGDHDNDHFGFVLPPRFIIRTAEEAWAGIKVVADTVCNCGTGGGKPKQ